MSALLRVGVAGTGRIAQALVASARHAREVRIVAVSSRHQASADAFATEHGIDRAHQGAERLAADDGVDLVYVASLNHLHHRDVCQFLRAGKHVLCEKPFALDATQAADMIATAARHDRFLMEAMWSRFLPSWQRVRALVADGAIGEPLSLSAELGFASDDPPDGRLRDLTKGGGSLLDSGVYPHALASWLLGEPTRIHAVADIGPTGVDEQTACTLTYASGAHAQIRSSFRTALASAGYIAGPTGAVELAPRLHRSTRVVLRRAGRDDITEVLPFEGTGLHLQLTHVAHCIAGGLSESPVMPLADTLAIMRTLDAIRAQIGLRYDQ